MRHAGIFRKLAGALAGSVAAIVLLAAGPSQGGVTINDNGACASWSWDVDKYADMQRGGRAAAAAADPGVYV